MIFGEGSKRRTGLKVFANTWFLCMGQACVFPHLTRYYDLDLHLSDFYIGLMMALPALGAVMMQPLWGILADRMIGRTKTIRLTLIMNILMLIFFAFSYQKGGFPLLLISGTMLYISYSAGLPLNSAIILSFLGKKNRHLFGRMRVAGSISFTLTMFLICPLVIGISIWFGLYGRTLLFLTAGIFYFITILTTFWDENHFERHVKPEFDSFLNLFRNPNMVIFYLSIFCVSIGASAGIQYLGPYVGHRGLSERFFSTLWLVGVSVEIICTYNLHRFAQTIGLKYTVLLGFAAEFIRWFGMSMVDAPGLIIALNCFHGPAVLGVLFASAMYLDAECEESIRSTAQAMLYFSFVSGQVTGYILASALVNHYSYLPRYEAIQNSFFWFSLFALFAAIMGTIFLEKVPRRS